MIKFSKILNEKITSNKQKKDKQVFDYSSIVNSEWNKIIKKAQDFQDIHFDLENNEELGDKRTFYIEKNLRKNQPVKYEINASLCRAGGDWEFPLLYFKIELTNNYGLTNSKYEKNPEYVWDLKSDYSGLYKNYAIIPPVEAGNKFKQKNNSGMAFTDEDDEYENLEISDKDKSNAWKWLEKYLENAVEKRHEMLDEGNKMISLKKLIKEEIKMGQFLNLLKPYCNKFKDSTANVVPLRVDNTKKITHLNVVKPGFGIKNDEIQYWVNNHGQQFIDVSKDNQNLEKILSIAKSNNISIES